MSEQLEGLTGRISVPVGEDLPGEILIMLRGGCEGFTAYSSGGEVLKKNAHAVVIEQTGNRTVLVTATGG
jgi:hypothetical protein